MERAIAAVVNATRMETDIRGLIVRIARPVVPGLNRYYLMRSSLIVLFCRCEELGPCVECQAYKTGSLNATCETCTNSLELVDKFDEEFNPEVKDCQVLLNHGCRMHFQYSYDQNQLIVVRALKEKICSVPPLAWIIGVMVTVIIAGIVMLLIWKICTTIHDRREYSKFEEEKKKLKWHSNQNPLYKGATSNYDNPAFKRQSVKT